MDPLIQYLRLLQYGFDLLNDDDNFDRLTPTNDYVHFGYVDYMRPGTYRADITPTSSMSFHVPAAVPRQTCSDDTPSQHRSETRPKRTTSKCHSHQYDNGRRKGPMYLCNLQNCARPVHPYCGPTPPPPPGTYE